MRGIKFRAWNGNRMLTMAKGGFCDFELSGGEVYVSLNGMGFSEQDYPLVQYTGLKDRDGVEIYEGDIYETPYTKLIYIITFNNGFYGGAPAGSTPTEPMWCSDEDGESGPLDWVKVIGNIYETPELLQQDNGQG